MENWQCCCVRGQVKAVLAWAGPGRAPVVELVQRPPHGLGRFSENLEQPDLIHAL